MNYSEIYAKEISQVLKDVITYEETLQIIERPKFHTQGDIAFPCFSLAKKFRKSPNHIAKEIAEQVSHTLFDKVVADGPYVNVFLNKKEVSKEVMAIILKQGNHFGTLNIGNGENVVIDFSSPNIAKPFSMGHLRSTVIGNSLALIAEKCGFQSIKVNHLGDWGTQFGKLIVAYKHWGNEEKVKENPIKQLLELYVKFHDEAEKDKHLEDEARLWFKKLEDGDEHAIELWNWFRDESLKEFSSIYNLLGIKFDSYHGEAFYNDKMEETLNLLVKSGLLSESEGADVVDLSEYNYPPCLIKKSDGATLYATRDLTAAIYRKETYQFSKALYVVGHEQSLHFNQVFAVLKKLGFTWSNNLVHIPFGFILKDGKKMSTRKGKVVLLEEVINETISLAKHSIEMKNPKLINKDKVAKMVAIGSLIFHDLKNERLNNVEFSMEEMLKFEGETGPYVQYTHARANSLIRKSGQEQVHNIEGLADELSWSVIKLLIDFPNVIKRSYEKFEPSQIAKYLIDLAQEFNKYYGNVKVLVKDSELISRLGLVTSVMIVLQEGLRLLGIEAPEEM
ncbi:arginine--tRNA ligase [Bacillus sp. SCS-151]|uniref:arginine--tRNA ligase n=1 Tax=Nanhaiella sioensis TaxID=3115293 RepID=UPI0039790A02